MARNSDSIDNSNGDTILSNTSSSKATEPTKNENPTSTPKTTKLQAAPISKSYSILKTMSIVYFILGLLAGNISIFKKSQIFVSYFSIYKDINSALIASYLLYSFSVIEHRFGHVKFFKWFLIHSAVTLPITLILNQTLSTNPGHYWLIFGVFPIIYKLSYVRSAILMPIFLLISIILSSNKYFGIAAIFFMAAGQFSEYILKHFENSTNFSKKLNGPIRNLIILISPIFSFLPVFIDSIFKNPEIEKFPFLATSSWRRQEILEKIETAGMLNNRFRGFLNGNARAQGVNYQNFGRNPQFNQNIRPPMAGPSNQTQNQRTENRVDNFVLDESKLEILKSMGFDENRSKLVLRQTSNNVSEATNLLLAEA